MIRFCGMEVNSQRQQPFFHAFPSLALERIEMKTKMSLAHEINLHAKAEARGRVQSEGFTAGSISTCCVNGTRKVTRGESEKAQRGEFCSLLLLRRRYMGSRVLPRGTDMASSCSSSRGRVVGTVEDTVVGSTDDSPPTSCGTTCSPT
jgi:hypothetical protein